MSYYSPVSRTDAIDAVAIRGNWISLHDGDPGTTGANEVSGSPYARKQTTWPAASSGVINGSAVEIDVPEGSAITITHIGVWTTETTGEWVTGAQLEPHEDFSSTGGVLRVTPTLVAKNAS